MAKNKDGEKTLLCLTFIVLLCLETICERKAKEFDE